MGSERKWPCVASYTAIIKCEPREREAGRDARDRLRMGYRQKAAAGSNWATEMAKMRQGGSNRATEMAQNR